MILVINKKKKEMNVYNHAFMEIILTAFTQEHAICYTVIYYVTINERGNERTKLGTSQNKCRNKMWSSKRRKGHGMGEVTQLTLWPQKRKDKVKQSRCDD